MKRNRAMRMKRFPFERVLKMTRTMLRAGIAAGLLLMCAPAFAQVKISWAENALGNFNPSLATRAPDGKVSGISDSAYLYVVNFNVSKDYNGLAQLLGLTDDELNNWDIIAFEGNQNILPGKGWESSIWFITDQVRAIAGVFDENIVTSPANPLIATNPPNPLRFMSGTLKAADYVNFFGIKEFKTPCVVNEVKTGCDVEYAGWILIDVPEGINLNATQFRIWVSGALIGTGKSPDPDAFGVIRHTTQ